MPFPALLEDRVQAVRRFNRFYTNKIGVLRESYEAPFSLTEARVLFELAHRAKPTAGEIGRELNLDAGYLSRILRGFEKKGLVSRAASKEDGRQQLLALTAKGKSTFAKLNARGEREAAALLERVPPGEQARAVQAMQAIEGVFGEPAEPKVPYILRPHRPGDMGWIVHRQALLYWEEYGWDERYEALASEIVAKFIQNFDPKMERCWVAEREGEIVGSVFVVKKTKSVAKLRLLYVESKARGLGIGLRLVQECVRFAREAGYRKMILWTQSNLLAARRIYAKCGFQCVEETPQKLFGHDLVSETWELKL